MSHWWLSWNLTVTSPCDSNIFGFEWDFVNSVIELFGKSAQLVVLSSFWYVPLWHFFVIQHCSWWWQVDICFLCWFDWERHWLHWVCFLLTIREPSWHGKYKAGTSVVVVYLHCKEVTNYFILSSVDFTSLFVQSILLYHPCFFEPLFAFYFFHSHLPFYCQMELECWAYTVWKRCRVRQSVERLQQPYHAINKNLIRFNESVLIRDESNAWYLLIR